MRRTSDGRIYPDKLGDMRKVEIATCGYCGNKTRFHHPVIIKIDDLDNDCKRLSICFHLCTRCQMLFDKSLEDIIYD